MISLILMQDEQTQVNPTAKASSWSKIKSPTSGSQVETYLAKLVGGGGKRSTVLGMNLLDKVQIARSQNAYEKKDLAVAFDQSIQDSE